MLRVSLGSEPAPCPSTAVSALSDEVLAVVTAAGDSAAFSVLIERNERFVRSLVRSVIGTSSETEDLAQDVFIRAWQQIQQYKPQYPFRSWLGRIAVNLSINAVRRRGRRKLHAPLLAVVQSPGGETEVINVLDSSRVRRALARCPAREAEALTMRYLADLSYEQIATTLAITVISARILVCRGLKRLRKCYKQVSIQRSALKHISV